MQRLHSKKRFITEKLSFYLPEIVKILNEMVDLDLRTE